VGQNKRHSEYCPNFGCRLLRRVVHVVDIADDITGSCADATLLIDQANLRTIIIPFPDKISEAVEVAVSNSVRYDAVVISTNTRVAGNTHAYEVLRETAVKLKSFYNPVINCKRIDTTLRGNIGSEIDALLDAGVADVAVVVPAYPDAGRIYVNDTLYVRGVPLKETEASRELPLPTSSLRELLSVQSKRAHGIVSINEVKKGPDNIVSEVERLVNDFNNEVIVVEATTNEEILSISRALLRTKRKVLYVSPGPLCASVSALTRVSEEVKDSKSQGVSGLPRLALASSAEEYILVVAGSATKLAESQVRYLVSSMNATCVRLDLDRVLSSEGSRREELITMKEFTKKVLLPKPSTEVVVLSTCRDKLYSVKEAEIIRSFLATLSKEVIAETKQHLKGLVIVGGDTALSTLRELDINLLVAWKKVMPLVALVLGFGRDFVVPLITKGGLVGSEDALVKCVEELKKLNKN